MNQQAESAPQGRSTPLPITGQHRVTGHSMVPPWPAGMQEIVLGLGCFWGAERLFWELPGVHVTAVGYAGGITPNPTYEETCTGRTGHAEVVRVVFDPEVTSLETLLRSFWEAHDPTQGDRQGNDIGPQYRSIILTLDEDQQERAQHSREAYAAALEEQGRGPITTDIQPLDVFYYAEEYHQQYLDRHPNGYCGLKGTGVTCPLP
ncbi:peptide-methionine (S)-S-oxide reductase MsrA [Halomonas sp. 18H]|nr:peptide-methionine (S)-S-oxide reductase MsrA [Halomonas sp. 18H]MCW4151857.1 peptide-methionine (S)-S-oxide reductase MsrA [Halomonas sp. 18H]